MTFGIDGRRAVRYNVRNVLAMFTGAPRLCGRKEKAARRRLHPNSFVLQMPLWWPLAAAGTPGTEMTATCIIAVQNPNIANPSQFLRKSFKEKPKEKGRGATDEGIMDVPIEWALVPLILLAIVYFVKGLKQKREQDRHDD